ncbi:hypothetical protein QG9_0980 [Clostridioides difficile CD178]|nr:hypothetical protein QG9_0980 [Clostridioides difficile CD178]EQG53403.1 hypothetical protein QIY_1034 [Clostridioides difficile DA00141]EQI74583.1 hypothetical protein QQE_1048 [Clostridioides difficile Y381]EQK03368.1 hypothetical protein QUK_1035 [Clostridioides difficile P61]
MSLKPLFMSFASNLKLPCVDCDSLSFAFFLFFLTLLFPFDLFLSSNIEILPLLNAITPIKNSKLFKTIPPYII